MLKKFVPTILLAGYLAAAAASQAADRLRDEKSAFLRTFIDSPVDWMPWGDEAMARAKSEQKPVFLFIGSFTNELSGAMRRQSFANPKNADWLNKNFVCVVVDRDERPDVAALFQTYVSNLKQLNGWPLNIWLTSDFQPYEGATYLSPSEDWGAPGFLKLASQAKSAWDSDPNACRKRATDAAAQLAPPAQAPKPPVWNLQKCRTRLTAAAAAWEATYDPAQGGFGDLPKSPEPELVRFMLLQSAADHDSAVKTLRIIASSAIRDPLDGGFFRHAADGAWHIPYQQKVLVDQARIAQAFLDAAASGADTKSFNQCARGALDFVLTHFANADGTYAAAEDATGDDFAGYYAWTEKEIDEALGADSAAFKLAHGVEPDGNVPTGDDPSATFAHKNLLRAVALSTPAQAEAEARLLALRNLRPAPPRDTRATAAAHGLLMSVLSRAAKQLDEPRYSAAARQLLLAIEKNFVVSPDGTAVRLSDSGIPAEADDYAALASGCRDFARLTNNKDAMALTDKFLFQLAARYYDPASSAYFGAPAPLATGFFIRPFGVEDPPSAEAMALPARALHAAAVAAEMSESLEEGNPQAAGDQLLALAFFSGEGPVR